VTKLETLNQKPKQRQMLGRKLKIKSVSDFCERQQRTKGGYVKMKKITTCLLLTTLYYKGKDSKSQMLEGKCLKRFVERGKHSSFNIISIRVK